MIRKIYSYLSKRKLCKNIRKNKINHNFLCDVDLSHTNLSNIDMKGAKLSRCTLYKTKFKKTILQGAMMNDANLSKANLSDANLSYVNFSKSNLRGANLSNANLYKANFNGADLSYANLSNVKIDNTTDFTNANLTHVIINLDRIKIAHIDGAIIKEISSYDKLLYNLGYEEHSNNLTKIVPMNIVPKL